jgi:hypothetical protein
LLIFRIFVFFCIVVVEIFFAQEDFQLRSTKECGPQIVVAAAHRKRQSKTTKTALCWIESLKAKKLRELAEQGASGGAGEEMRNVVTEVRIYI